MRETNKLAAVTAFALLLLLSSSSVAQQSVPGVSVKTIVTVEAKQGKAVPSLEPQDLEVRQNNQRRPVSDIAPLKGSPMELLLLIDDSARASFNTEIATLKQFVNSLPANVQVAVGYMRNGLTDYAEKFTPDHTAAANSIRIAAGPGGADVSPYDSLSDAIKKWPKTGTDRREVIMISSGIEALGGGFAPENPYVNKGISDAQAAGVIVYSIYSPSIGHLGHTFWRETWGQNFLSQLSDETGGEAYINTFGAPVSFDPYLQEIRNHFDNQFQLTFAAIPERKSELQSVHIRTSHKDADVAAPDKVFVPASL